MSRHKKHKPLELTEALEHVVYEIWKYKQSIKYYSEISVAGGDAAIEFRVLHHRILLEFFHCNKKHPHPDSVFAWEYLDTWQQAHDPRQLTWFKAYMDRCHTMLAHISTERPNTGDKSKTWADHWKQVESHLDRIIPHFLGGLSKNNKETCHRWINEWLNGPYKGNDVLMQFVEHVSL